MKKQVIFFALMWMFQLSLQAQVNVRKNVKSSDTTKVFEMDPKKAEVPQPGMSAAPSQQAPMPPNTKYYSIDPTAFSSSWGVHEIQRVQTGGASLNPKTTYGTAPYLVAPVNLPHDATIINVKVIFHDVSGTQDLRAILWQSGPNFGTPDSYNLAQVQSNYSGGSITQTKVLKAKVDNENHSYYVQVSLTNDTQWPVNGELRITRVTIAYTEAE